MRGAKGVAKWDKIRERGGLIVRVLGVFYFCHFFFDALRKYSRANMGKGGGFLSAFSPGLAVVSLFSLFVFLLLVESCF